MREKIYTFVYTKDTRLSKIYDFFMTFLIVIGIIPLMFKKQNTLFLIIDCVVIVFFVLDYVLRTITADYYIGKGKKSFLIYLLTPMAIIDLISILSGISIINENLKLFKILKLLRTFRFIRIIKLFRYSNSINMLATVLKKQKKPLLLVLNFALSYIFLCATVMFTIEPEIFNNFLDALYWSTISLTSVGYGDIVPTTELGKVITMISVIIGIGIIALPSGIITAGYMKEINNERN